MRHDQVFIRSIQFGVLAVLFGAWWFITHSTQSLALLLPRPELVWQIADIMSDNAARTLAFGMNSALRFDYPVACKTGTSTDFRDNWTIGFTPEKAPEHVRNFLRLASAGVYDGTSWHRVVKGFVVQTGHMPTRAEPLSEAQQRLVHDLKAEFNDQLHVLGTVSMARLAEPDTANTSFFIVTAPAQMLDQKYTVFGKVLSGIEVVQKIEAAPVNGEAPVERIELKRVRVERQ